MDMFKSTRLALMAISMFISFSLSAQLDDAGRLESLGIDGEVTRYPHRLG